MKELSIKNLHMLVQVLQQYRRLTVNGNKFFYYTYGKLDIKLQSMLKSNNQTYEEVSEMGCLDLTVNITFEELKTLMNRNRIQKRDINNLIKDIKGNSSLTLTLEDGEDIIFIYKHVSIDNTNKRLEIEFNEDAVKLFQAIRQLPFADVNFEDILNLKNKYQINLYLYAISLLRGNKGNINISIDKVRDILAGDSVVDDYNFIHRFISKPAKEINDNENIRLKILPKRNKENIELKVIN